MDCPDDIYIEVDCNTEGTEADWQECVASDNSGTTSLVRSHVPGQFFEEGITPVSYTFTDPFGNAASYIFNVVVVKGMKGPSNWLSPPNILFIHIGSISVKQHRFQFKVTVLKVNNLIINCTK